MAPLVQLVEEATSDWNRRFGLRLSDGAEVEAVLYRGDTLCVSSQVGCAVRCPFCASGANGLGRSLTLEELRGQVALVRGLGHEVVRCTVSGVGEPLHAFDAVVPFVRAGAAEGRPTSLTTSGGPLSRLVAVLHEPHNGVTISVHAGSEAVRARLVPKAPSLGELFAALADVVPGLGRNRRKKLALSYLLVEGENDTDDELLAFAARARPLDLAVHLYAYNPIPNGPYRRLDRARYEAAYARLVAEGLRVRMSSQARIDANGGCGTLVALRASRVAAGDREGALPRGPRLG